MQLYICNTISLQDNNLFSISLHKKFLFLFNETIQRCLKKVCVDFSAFKKSIQCIIKPIIEFDN